MFFFCKKKTAYELRISDWSSDVCSCDLGWGSGRGARSRGPLRQMVLFSWRLYLPGNGGEVQLRFRESPLRFDEKPLDAAVMSKDKPAKIPTPQPVRGTQDMRSEEHTSELQSLMRISYAVFCLKKKKQHKAIQTKSPDTHQAKKTTIT